MKQFLKIILASLIFHSCVMDTVYDCKIINNTIDTIHLRITFDKNYLDKIYEGQKQKYVSYLKLNIGQDSGVYINDFDTINLTASYKIIPKVKFTLEHGMSVPNYFSYKDLTIIAKDTLIFHNKKEISEAFKKNDGDYLITIN
ncbi:MAG: hypothetical protein KGL19_13105 [Bacteroidota bacterium]|nr:hypothetical protein [Bacteroidota bacterium]